MSQSVADSKESLSGGRTQDSELSVLGDRQSVTGGEEVVGRVEQESGIASEEVSDGGVLRTATFLPDCLSRRFSKFVVGPLGRRGVLVQTQDPSTRGFGEYGLEHKRRMVGLKEGRLQRKRLLVESGKGAQLGRAKGRTNLNVSSRQKREGLKARVSKSGSIEGGRGQ